MRRVGIQPANEIFSIDFSWDFNDFLTFLNYFMLRIIYTISVKRVWTKQWEADAPVFVDVRMPDLGGALDCWRLQTFYYCFFAFYLRVFYCIF
jgi:hypothetical protein